MAGRSGLVSYIKFVTSTTKGDFGQTEIANPWKLGDMSEDRMNYTGEKVTESFAYDASHTDNKTFVLGWTPAAAVVKVVKGSSVLDPSTGYTFTPATATLVLATALTSGESIKVYYVYDNAYIAAKQIPTIKAIREEIAITAKPRRIAVEYSDLAAFEYKQETGADLGKALQTQAVAEMTYEIDCELVDMLCKAGDVASASDAVSFNDVCPVGVGIKDHYALLAKKIADASNNIYKRTKKYMANYMICGANVRTAIAVLDNFKPVSGKQVAGPYFAGELDGLKVYVSPNVDADTFYVGFNGQELDTSAVLFAPWMGLVPTQLLGFKDGTMSQGWAIMYGTATLNNILVAKGTITHNALNSDKTVYQA